MTSTRGLAPGNITFPGLTKFAETIIKLNARGRVLPIQGHNIAGILDNVPLQHEVLQLLKVSCLCLEIPDRATIALMPCEEVTSQFSGLTQALEKVFYVMGMASRPDGGFSVFPDAFNATHGDLLSAGGGYNPFATLMAI